MKKIILSLFFLFSIINAQDKLITLSGAEYQGIYLGIKGDKVEFVQSGKTNSVLVPKSSVKTVMLSSGEIIDFSSTDISAQVPQSAQVPNNNQQFSIVKTNDELTTLSGKVFNGKYIGSENGKIQFTETGNLFPTLVPENSVKSVILSNGEIVFGQVPKDNVMSETSGYNPCEDERYLKIKDKPLDDMSDREYNYFLSIDKECKEYQSKAQVSTPRSAMRSPISSNQKGSIPIIPNQTSGSSNLTDQLKLIAHNDATEDFKMKNPQNQWMVISFLSSAVLSPLIGGTISILMANESKPDTELSTLKTLDLQNKYKNDTGAIAIYQGFYKEKKSVLHKKAAGEGAIGGCIGGFLLNYLIITSI